MSALKILKLKRILRFITTHPLNRDQKFRSIVRFMKWQIGSRLVPGAVVCDWIDGSKFLVRAGETGLTGSVYTGLHEFEDMAFVLHVLRDEDLFIDVGANVGSFTILACAARGASGYAFEPVPSTYKRLVANLHLNHLEKVVKSFNVAVGREQGSIAFTSGRNEENHALASGEESDDKIDVEVTTLDTALEGVSPSLMKIDVEGYETLVLEGASETLKKQSIHSVVMELNGNGARYGFDESRILAMMLDHGFKTYSYDPRERTLVNLQGKNLEAGNTLFIRDEPFVLDRLKSAPAIDVNGKKI